MQSKPTKYNGYNFRSRTEARWAVFFDALGIKYHYEHEDFVLQTGDRYLPDFWLPDLDAFAEVKGTDGFIEDEYRKCLELSFLTKKDVLLLDGPPDFKHYCYYDNSNSGQFGFVVLDKNNEIITTEDQEILPNGMVYICNEYPFPENQTSSYYGKYLGDFIFYPEKGRIFVYTGWDDEYLKENKADFLFSKGVYASRAARFEF